MQVSKEISKIYGKQVSAYWVEFEQLWYIFDPESGEFYETPTLSLKNAKYEVIGNANRKYFVGIVSDDTKESFKAFSFGAEYTKGDDNYYRHNGKIRDKFAFAVLHESKVYAF